MQEHKEGVVQAARLVELAALTAPKAKGQDSVRTMVLSDSDDIAVLATQMEHMARAKGLAFCARDAGNIKKSDAVLLVGCVDGTIGLDCGACGFKACAEKEGAQGIRADYNGPNCAFKLLDLGIALGSAAKTASVLNLDSRIMYSAGAAAKASGYLADCSVVVSLPLSASSKNIFFDRG